MPRVEGIGLGHILCCRDDTKVRRHVKSTMGRMDKRVDVIDMDIDALLAESASRCIYCPNSFDVSPVGLRVPQMVIVLLTALRVLVFMMPQ